MTKKKTKKKTPRKKRPSEIKAVAERAAAKKPEVTPYPQAGRKITDFEDQLDLQLVSDDKPKRGRPLGSTNKPPADDQVGPALELVVNFIKFPFELWSIRVPEVPGLALTDEEAKQVAEPARELIEYYLPKIPPIAWAWASLGVSSFWIMRSRLLLIEEYKKQAASSAPPAGKVTDQRPTGQGGPPPAGMPTTAEINQQIKNNKKK